MPQIIYSMDKASKEHHREAMISMIRQWQESGKSQVQFCTERQIKPSGFNYWLKRYRESFASGVFVPVQVVRGKQSRKVLDTSIEIHYPNGTRVHLPASATLTTIRALIGM